LCVRNSLATSVVKLVEIQISVPVEGRPVGLILYCASPRCVGASDRSELVRLLCWTLRCLQLFFAEESVGQARGGKIDVVSLALTYCTNRIWRNNRLRKHPYNHEVQKILDMSIGICEPNLLINLDIDDRYKQY
jgi:hypothetical protein